MRFAAIFLTTLAAGAVATDATRYAKVRLSRRRAR